MAGDGPGGPRRLVVPAALRRAVERRHRTLVALRPPARGARRGGRRRRRRRSTFWNGIDDDVLDAALAAGPAVRATRQTAFRLARADEPREAPAALPRGARASRASTPTSRSSAAAGRSAPRAGSSQKLRARGTVVFAGRLPYAETLRRIAAADAVVQTSIGFETQGMTVFEAASLGTPAVVSDPDIGAELGSGFWAGGGWRRSPALADTLRRAASDIVGRNGRGARPVDPRAVPPVVAHRGDGRGLRPRTALSRSSARDHPAREVTRARGGAGCTRDSG